MLKRELLRDLLLYATSDVVSRGLLFLAIPIYTRIFSPAEYGALNLALTVMGLLLAVLILGGDSAFALYYAEAKTEQDRRELTSTALTILLAATVGFAVVALPLAWPLSRLLFGSTDHTALVVLVVLAVPASIANRLLAQVLRSQFRAAPLVALTIATAVLSIGGGLVLAVPLGLGVKGIVLGVVVAEVSTLPVRLHLVRSMIGLTFQSQLGRKFLSYGLPLVPTAVAYWIFLGSDRIILGKLSTLEEVGLYSVANGAVGMLLLTATVIGQAWSPHAFEIAVRRPNEAPVLFGRFLTYVAALLGLLCVTFSVFASEVVHLIATPGFYSAERSIPPLALALVAYGTTLVTCSGICLTKKTGYLARYSAYAAVLNVGLCICLIPAFGHVGAAWASTAAYVYLTGAYYWRSQKLWRAEYETRRLATIAVAIVLFTAFGPVLPDGYGLTSLGSKAAYCACFIATVFLLRGLDGRDVHMLRSMLGRRRMTSAGATSAAG